MNSIVVTSTKQNIKFGYEGEDNVTKIIFPYDESWLEYGEGNFEVRILRCGDEVAYTATEVVDDRQAMTLTMTVTDIELSVRGRGEMQLCYVCPDSIKKSPIYQYTVNRSVDYKYAVDPPEGSIIASVEKSLSEIKNTTNRLSNSVISIESSIDDVNSQIDNINDKISEFDEEIDSIGEVETRVDNLETSIQSINGRINTAEGNINENTESISDLNESVTELENRKVTDLETSGGRSDSGKYLTVGTDGKIKATSLTIPPTITVDASLSTTSTNPVQNKVIKTELNNINNNIATCNTEISKINGSLGNEDWKSYKKAKAAVSKDNTTVSYDESTDTLSVTSTSAKYNGFYVTMGAIPVGSKCHVSFDYSVVSGTPEFLVGTKQETSGSTITRLADPVDGHCDNTWVKQPNELYYMVYVSLDTKKAVSISITNFIMEVSSGGAKDVVTRDTFNVLDGTTPIDVTWTPGWIDLSGDTTDFTATVGVSLSHAIIPCKNIDSFTLTLANDGDTKALMWAFVDDDGNILAKSLDTKAEYEIVNVPSQATKIVLHTNKPWISDAVRTQPSLIKNAITKIGYEKDLTHTFTLVDGSGVYYQHNGQNTVSTTASRTPFIEVTEFDAIRFIRRRTVNSSSYGCAFYKEAVGNKDGNFIKGYREPYGYSAYGYEEKEVPVPEGAVYFRTTWYIDTLSYRDAFPFYIIGVKYGEFGQHIEDIESSTKSISDVVFSNPDDMYAEEMVDTIGKVENSLTEPALVFMWSTDCHRYSSNADGVQNFADMVRNMRYFNKKVPCDFMLNTGDMTDGNTAKATTLTRAHTCVSELRTIGIPYVWAQGNHDTNYFNTTFSIEECYKAYFTATSKDAILNKSEYGTDYYIDYIGLGVRFIVLNANNVDNAHDKSSYVYGRTVAAWLESALDTDMDVIIALHQTPVSSQTYNNQGTTGSAGVISAINNFISNGGHLVMISGHTHADMAFISPWLSIMQDCQRYCSVTNDGINGRDDITTGFIDVIRKNARSKEDARKDLWSVGIYKPISKDFDFIRFGAGKDRYFHTTPIAPQTLVSRFDSPTWATSDENIATVVDGVVTGVATGKCTIVARDAEENYECWIVNVE